jgi:hypothetical protein
MRWRSAEIYRANGYPRAHRIAQAQKDLALLLSVRRFRDELKYRHGVLAVARTIALDE